MATDPVKNLEKRYDDLVNDIIGELEALIKDLRYEKVNIRRSLRVDIKKLHEEKMQVILDKRNELEEAHSKGGYGIEKIHIDEAKKNHEKFEDLLKEEMTLDSGEVITLQSEEKRIEKDIVLIYNLRIYIEKNTNNKGNRFKLDTAEMQRLIKRVYNNIASRKQEEERAEKHEEMKKTIESDAKEIIKRLDEMLEAKRLPP